MFFKGLFILKHLLGQLAVGQRRFAVLIVGVAGYLAKGVRHLGDVVQRVIGIGGLAAQFVHYGDEPVHLVVLVLLRVASLLKILLLKY